MSTVLGAALVVAAFGSIGFIMAAEKRKTYLCAEGYMLLIHHIAVRLPSLAGMNDIVAEFENKTLAEEGVMQILQSENSTMPCNKRLKAAIELHKADRELYTIMNDACKELGSTDYARQQQSLHDTEQRLASLCEKRSKELANGEKCYKWLGVLGGVMTVILLL